MLLQRLSLKRALPLFMAVAMLSALARPAMAASLIRDAEIEQTLRNYLDPILISADIDPTNVRVFIVDDLSINAFVAGGMNIFVNSGLILATTKPGMLIGVLAHETGHISGAHLSQMEEKTDRATLGSVLGAVLGAAMIAGGAGDAGVGVIAGSQNMAFRNFLSDVRGNEEQADQAAMKYLDANDISATGLLQMFEVLRRKQSSMDRTVDPYLQTHPLSSNRIAVVRNHLAMTSLPQDLVPLPYIERHARLLARLRAFSWAPEQTLLFYPDTDQSFPAKYARAIATYRLGKLQDSVTQLQALQKDAPGDPFLDDTLGQFFYESGLPKRAVTSYKRAYKAYPESPLILTDLARALIAINEPLYLNEAIGYLERATRLDDGNADSWRLLATAYGKLKNNPMAYVALAQESALKGESRNAIAFAENALVGLPPTSAGAQLARDIKTNAEHHLLRQKEGKAY